jgi:NADH-quinone oxidoreductase subunit J|uniref:NADH dehydrogenase subunit 6 n=1 Tax=Ancyromonas sigmoides TaxID=85707 RepID=UPI0028D88B73|nr:NADH dehydrogenase subunit 6 [Ancyromonas sigmoides]WMQ52534.1 NADH dehydrogenase subunit 6 [Ancyromonas sigmoides]
MQELALSSYGILFGCLSLLIFSMAVISSRNPIYSLFYLICVFIQISMLLLAAGVEFISFLILMVYVGAISILFLFVVMMMDINLLALKQSPLNQQGLFITFVFLNFVYWFNIFSNFSMQESTPLFFVDWSSVQASTGSLFVVASHLYSSYAVAFILASYILLVAMVGAIVITLKQKPYVKRQDVLYQNHRDFEKTVRKISTAYKTLD